MAWPIDIPNHNHPEQTLSSSPESDQDVVFTPADSLSTSVSSLSTVDPGSNHQTDQCDPQQPTFSVSGPDAGLGLWQKAEQANELLDVASAIPFGHGPECWLYHPKSRLFDLTRLSPSKLLIPTQHEQMSGIVVDPTRTLLVVVDMQNYFIHPACYPHVGGLAAVQPILNVIGRCRQLGIQIGYLNWVIEEKDLEEMPPAVQRGWSADRLKTHGIGWHVNLGSELPDGQGRCLWKGSWNAELYEPIRAAARPEDVTFLKNRPSGMWSPDCDMARYIANHNKKTIFFAGVNTDQCVLGTLTDCYSKSYDCLMVKDCVATATTGLMAQELVEWNVARNYGFVVDSDSVLASQMLQA